MSDSAKWTASEDKLLLQLAAEGKSYAEIAKITGRSKGGVRNRLSRVRNPDQGVHRIIIHNMSAEEFGALLKAQERAKELDQTKAFAKAEYEDYKRLYEMCKSLLKAYKNHRNTKAAFDVPEAELAEHFPCPF